ncbi:MAG TPA: flagellar basal-body MS-ring/collar protein FliF [Acidimicrobiales bacterium]|nr:flagellar basal-body MS-ring/collar protein FliF [Acidimicrobiales bacterium]
MTAPIRAGKEGGVADRFRARSQMYLSGFSSGQKAVVVIAVLAVVIGGYLFMSWAAKPTYVPLFSNLSSSDAAAITQKLAANKVPYQLAEDGEQILVPTNDVYQQRLDMAAAGLPSSGSQGYSLLDTAGVTTSEFQQQVEYQQAVSDELEQTIESINGVQSSQVSVVIPQESLFATNSASPSASVLVSLEAGATLSAEQVQAIVHLVASSIEGLSPNEVTVVDQNGDVLNAPGSGSANVAAGTMDQQETEAYDQSLDNSLQDMLATVLGPGNAVVQANAQLDFSQTQISSQIYNPDNQKPIPVSQATSKETYMGSGATAAASGVLGVTSVPSSSSPSAASTTTVTTPATKAAAGGKATTTTTTATTATTAGGSAVTTTPSYAQIGQSQQNVVSEVTKTVNSAPGSLQRLSIAVAVNDTVKGVSPAEIKELVSEAAGLQPSRGDSIQVAFVPFDQTVAKDAAAQLKAAEGAKAQATMMSEGRDVIVILVVLVLLVVALRRITKTTRVPLALPAGYQPLELEAGEVYEGEGDATMALPAAVRDMSVYQSAPAPLQAEVNQIGHMIEQEPERIAEMLRAWLEAAPGER